MRRLLPLVLIILMLPFVLPAVAQSEFNQVQFVTNTPRPVSFVTNTPAGPTATPLPPSETPLPSETPSPTLTPTETSTSTSTPTNTSTPTETPSPTPTPNGPFIYPQGVNPLTGLPYPNEEAMNRRNLIVKISNYPPVVRPQTGINLADVVYELEAEGGVTRFAAIFRSNAPERVGSVRSARLADLHLIQMYNALIAYSGTSEPIQNIILDPENPYLYRAFSPLKGDNCENAGFCRDERTENLDFEHTLFLNTQRLYELATQYNVNTGYQARGFAFSPEPDPSENTAQDIYIEWYGQADARWQYDEETGRYLRWTDGVPHFDAGDNSQLWADNLVVIEVPHERRPDLFPPGSNFESLDIVLVDQGRAYVFRDGFWYQGYWRRANEDAGSALQLIYPGAPNPIMLEPGRTWVSVVRGLGNVTISEDLQDPTFSTSASR